jgi:hypothetical protein
MQESQFLVGKLQQEMHQLQTERDRYQVISLFLQLAPVSGVHYCCTQPDEFHVNRKFQSFY